jgi:beta-lactamase superfamily II metal-dependent hydrolase
VASTSRSMMVLSKMSGRLWSGVVAVLLVVAPLDSAGSLEIYFIDVEGGQATLIATPGGETMLVDAGYAGRGTFQSRVRRSSRRQRRPAYRGHGARCGREAN